MRNIRPFVQAAGGVLMLLSVGACTARGLVVREYVLSPLAMVPESGEAAVGDREISVGVGPVEVAPYLRRPQIVTREGEHRLRPSQGHQWAADFESQVARVLSENLSLLIPTNRVSTFPWQSPGTLDYRVPVQISRFERGPDGVVSLEARWLLAKGGGKEVLDARRSLITKPTSSSKYSSTVDAMSQAVAELSREIAAAIRRQALGGL